MATNRDATAANQKAAQDAAAALQQARINAGEYRAPSTAITPYQQAELALRQKELDSRTAADKNRPPSTAELEQRVRSAFGTLSSSYQTAEDAVAAILQNREQLARDGVDVQQLIQMIRANMPSRFSQPGA